MGLYVIGYESYRIRRNNAKYTAITKFKVIEIADGMRTDGQTDRNGRTSTAVCIASNTDAL